MPAAARAFPWYLAGIGSWLASSGMQTIVFPWIVTVVLHEPAAHRARILSLFQLGLMGGAPVGALLIGYMVALAGPRGGLSRRVHAARAGRAAAALPPLAAGAGVMRRDQRIS